MPILIQYTAISFLVFSTLSLGFVLDRHHISFALELFRIVGMSAGIFICLYLSHLPKYYVISLIPSLIFIPWIVKNKSAFRKEELQKDEIEEEISKDTRLA